MESLLNDILYEYSPVNLYLLAFGYFLLIYFGLGFAFHWSCKVLERFNMLHKIALGTVTTKQIGYEIRHSLLSIFVFGFSLLPIVILARLEWIELLPNTLQNVLIGLVLLNVWNELHFYLVHRFLHQRWWMKRVHFVHHRSIVPTVYSVYSFHWVEAAMLSTVPFILVLFIPLSPLAIFLYPISSILLNFAGHCNYRFGPGTGNAWKLFGTHHNNHHRKGKKNFGFALPILDQLFSQRKK